MRACICSKSGGIKASIRLLRRTLSAVFTAAPLPLASVLIAELCIGLIQTLTLIVWKQSVNAVESYIHGKAAFRTVLLFFAAGLFSYILMDLFRMILESLYTFLLNKLAETFEAKLFETCSTVNSLNFEVNELYNEITRARDSVHGAAGIVMIIGIFIMGTSRLASLGIYVFLHNPLFIFIVLMPVIPICITRIIRGKDMYRLHYSQCERRREKDYYKECLKHKETIVLQAASYFYDKWTHAYNLINDEETKTNKKITVIFLCMNILKYGVYICAVLIAAYYLYKGLIDVGTFVLLTGMLGTAHATIEIMVIRGGDINESLYYAHDYFSFLDKANNAAGVDNKSEAGKKDGDAVNSIILRDVCFQYPNAASGTLHAVNLAVKKGEKIAVIGVNGSGKSTLLKIISGLYNPTSGDVLYNGEKRLPEKIADCSIVFQQFCRYYTTLREAVGLGNVHNMGDTDALLQWLNRFNFDLNKTQSSVDVQLGRDFDGIELSGGEWQKIALARGFFKNSDLIILDEPAAHLDPVSEAALFHLFLELFKHKTGIIVTHTLRIAALADRIILMKNGMVVGSGSHKELLASNAYYRELHDAHMNMEGGSLPG